MTTSSLQAPPRTTLSSLLTSLDSSLETSSSMVSSSSSADYLRFKSSCASGKLTLPTNDLAGSPEPAKYARKALLSEDQIRRSVGCSTDFGFLDGLGGEETGVGRGGKAKGKKYLSSKGLDKDLDKDLEKGLYKRRPHKKGGRGGQKHIWPGNGKKKRFKKN